LIFGQKNNLKFLNFKKTKEKMKKYLLAALISVSRSQPCSDLFQRAYDVTSYSRYTALNYSISPQIIELTYSSNMFNYGGINYNTPEQWSVTLIPNSTVLQTSSRYSYSFINHEAESMGFYNSSGVFSSSSTAEQLIQNVINDESVPTVSYQTINSFQINVDASKIILSEYLLNSIDYLPSQFNYSTFQTFEKFAEQIGGWHIMSSGICGGTLFQFGYTKISALQYFNVDMDMMNEFINSEVEIEDETVELQNISIGFGNQISYLSPLLCNGGVDCVVKYRSWLNWTNSIFNSPSVFDGVTFQSWIDLLPSEYNSIKPELEKAMTNDLLTSYLRNEVIPTLELIQKKGSSYIQVYGSTKCEPICWTAPATDICKWMDGQKWNSTCSVNGTVYNVFECPGSERCVSGIIGTLNETTQQFVEAHLQQLMDEVSGTIWTAQEQLNNGILSPNTVLFIKEQYEAIVKSVSSELTVETCGYNVTYNCLNSNGEPYYSHHSFDDDSLSCTTGFSEDCFICNCSDGPVLSNVATMIYPEGIFN
jgi:hypothetical protein